MRTKLTSKLFSRRERSPKSPDFGNPTTGVVGLRIAAIVIGLAILIGGGIFVVARFNSQKQVNATNGNLLQTAKVSVGDLVISASGTGKLMPATESTFGFNTSGEVSQINVKIGEHVEAGQVLAQLDDTDAKIALSEAQQAMDKLTNAAAVTTAKQTLAEDQTALATAKEGLEYLISPEVLYWEEKIADREQILAEAKTAAQTDSSTAAQQKVNEAQTSLKFAQDSLVYFQQIYKSEYVPKTFTQYQASRGRRIRILQKKVIKIRDETTGVRSILVYPPTEGEIGMARAAYDLAKATVAEQQTYLDVISGGEIPQGATGTNLVTYLQTKHALEKAQYNLNATKLIAPISGTVTALNINVGDLASGSSIVTISNIDQPYSIDAYLNAKEWGQVKVGYEVDVTFDIIPNQVFKGTVTVVDPTLDTTSASSALVHFNARLNDTMASDLPSGSTASVDVIGGRAQNALLVPVEALHKFGDEKYALFVMENGKLSLRIVAVGIQDLKKAVITSGLKKGDVVSTGIVKTK